MRENSTTYDVRSEKDFRASNMGTDDWSELLPPNQRRTRLDLGGCPEPAMPKDANVTR